MMKSQLKISVCKFRDEIGKFLINFFVILDDLIYDVSHNLRSRSLATIASDNTTIEHSNRLIELTTDTFHSIVFDSNKVINILFKKKLK
jgi:hypothetical protein